MTVPSPTPCPSSSRIFVLRPPPEHQVPLVRHGPCCYWDHLTAQWVPVGSGTAGRST